ncbi:DNA topoisomerase IV subunit B [Paralimibaculum aggregatum]|uniref:DNA topoisomerase (ATP-hydrolyzing) n=1 Tax=Paralimibaculum aggregatum TaxID=3036245 RepID=A0ABQ6LM24_9RHOB|nr:DNA topoisomerase IV subunit B [Limibaculum sp. NKW23]GMG84257.1 DNA topoisomerase IV subunit B [Limibaculum sp. NKW23]
MAEDLFPDDGVTGAERAYDAASIEVLEGLEPVRKRPGMYVGGTDDRAMHHLVSEVLDNAMDEAVAGHASRIEIELLADGAVAITDNGRGIPVDPHPKFPDRSALEVILCTLHAGGKFSGKAYETSGGLHGVGVSVVNALSERLRVEVARGRQLYAQEFSRGIPQGPLQSLGQVANRRGTRVEFRPDPQIFGPKAALSPARLHRAARSKAYLFGGVEIRWRCAPERLKEGDPTPAEDVFRFPGGLADYLAASLADTEVIGRPFAGKVAFSERFGPETAGSVEWALAWTPLRDGAVSAYCNTIPTPQGGTHEAGFWAAVTKAIRAHGERANARKAKEIRREDITAQAAAMISVFIREPEFVGQTKDRLATAEAERLVEAAVRDRMDTWLGSDPKLADEILEHAIDRAEERQRRRAEKETQRKSATKRLRLPGKLVDCSRTGREGTEIFLVEGDSASGSGKMARDRETQAMLPLRGKVLNVLGAAGAKLADNKELQDLCQALGVGMGAKYREQDLRYDKVIVMTDADVDGAHISALLMTFFFTQMRPLIENGHLFLALPPLYRLKQGARTVYAIDEAEKTKLEARGLGGKGKIEVSRFKGLGEMDAKDLKATTMDPARRRLIKVSIDDEFEDTGGLVERLMGRRAETRFQFITERARFAEDLDL